MFVETEQFGKLKITFHHVRNDIDDTGRKHIYTKNQIRKGQYNPAYTDCEITLSDRTIIGVSVMNPQDNFCKSHGRFWALSRALQELYENCGAKEETLVSIIECVNRGTKSNGGTYANSTI